MMRSLFSGVSGLKVHQTRMDVIGNNIANINTIGFKSSRTTFSDMLSQVQSSAAAPTDGLGGVNAKQIGLGVNVESIDLIFTDSSPQQTGKNTDLALSGNGLFVLRNGAQSYYTRNGAFMFDEQGYYVMPGNGLRVQGWNATANGVINTNGTATDIIVPVGKTMEATATTTIDYSGNLNKESLLIDKITYVTATGVSAQSALDKVGTGTIDDPQSINVDGENVIAATLTMKDGSVMNVTSGYYEVGRSVPITTLATVYDSMGGRHEVTVLIDKDPTSADTGINTSAQETSNRTGYFYTDADGVEHELTANTAYKYTDAEGEVQYVSEDAVVKGVTDDSGTYAATKNSATVYSYSNDAGTHYVTADALVKGVQVDDGTIYAAEENSAAVYSYSNDAGTHYVTADALVKGVQVDDGTIYAAEENSATVYSYTANNATHYVTADQVVWNDAIEGYVLASDNTTVVEEVSAENAAYKYNDGTEDIYVAESAVIDATNVEGTLTAVTEVAAEDAAYKYNNGTEDIYVAESAVIDAANDSGTLRAATKLSEEAAAYKYNNGTEDIYVSEDALVDATSTDDGYVEVEVATERAYKYTDTDGDVHYVSEDDAEPRAIYDNRWRVYLAPGAGMKGPAAGDSFSNIVNSTESDGTTMTATMNYDEESGATPVTYLYFDDRGQFITNGRSQEAQITFSYGNGNGASDNVGVISFTGLTQYANSTTSFPITNGNSAGILQSLAIDGNGIINGTYTNGLVRQEAQIAVAQFNNSSGLVKAGTTIYQESNNSGAANVKTIGDFGLSVVSSALEMSNVDLATEFSDMIVTQRGFQANSKMTTTSDEMLETLVNMKR